MTLSLSGSEIVALSLESVLYGAYFVLFVGCFKVLFGNSSLNVRLLVVSVALFILITWHEILDVFRLIMAFKSSQTPAGGNAYYANVTSALSVMKTTVYVAETVLSDLFILYRSFIVWDKRWPIAAIPFLVFLADVGTGIGAVYELATPDPEFAFNKPQEQVTNAFFSCTLAVNALCTGLIAFRIWWTQRRNKAFKVNSNLAKVTVILIESGAVYVVSLVLLVATYSAKSIVFNIFLDILSPIIGIVFSLIIVRVGLGISSDAATRVTEPSTQLHAPSKRISDAAARCTDTDPSSQASEPLSSGMRLDTMTDIVFTNHGGDSYPLESQDSYKMEALQSKGKSGSATGDV